MKRRVFIRNSTLVGAGLGFGGMTTFANQSAGYDLENVASAAPFFKLSLAQWSLHKAILENGMDPLNFASKAKELGFEGLEYVNHLFRKELENASNPNQGIQKLVAKLNQRSKDHGVENLVMMVDLPSEYGNLAVGDKTNQNRAIEAHYPWIDATAALGCHSMRINMFGEMDVEKWKSASVDALNKLGEYAQKSDVNIIIENHGHFTSNAALLMEVLDKVDRNNCGVLPDFGNFCTKRENGERWGAKCVEEYDKYKGIKEMMPRAKAVSAKSYHFDKDGNETTIDYQKMIKIVKKAGYTGYIGVEYEGNQLSEEEGILATKNLLLKVA